MCCMQQSIYIHKCYDMQQINIVNNICGSFSVLVLNLKTKNFRVFNEFIVLKINSFINLNLKFLLFKKNEILMFLLYN